MKVTVIICTHNRCESLTKTLMSIAASVLPEAVAWDVLVVDNASTDRTRETVEDFSRRHPGRFHYLHQPASGKSLALNAGIREAKGELLVFTDDDVYVEPSWLDNLVKSLAKQSCAGVGGRTLPAGKFCAPKWLSCQARYALAPLALFDRGDDPCELTEPPFGNNMAYRKAIFNKYGGFREDLGPRDGGQGPHKSEDSELGHRLLAAGERIVYEPSAILYHATPESRITKTYFLQWWFDKARADIRAFGIPTDTKWFIAGSPYYFYQRVVTWTVRWLIAVRPARRFSCKVKVGVNLGQIKECYRLWKEKKTGGQRKAALTDQRAG